MVVTSAPSACQANMVQDLRALPSTCTTQHPHCEVSQPTCVPVRRRFSRKYCTSRVRGSTSAETALPFTVIATLGMTNLPKQRPNLRLFLENRAASKDSHRTPADLRLGASLELKV